MLTLNLPVSTNKGKTRWVKGQVTNPKGRRGEIERYGTVDIAAMARAHSVDALKTLVHCLRDPRYKLAAAIAILDRGYGKPHVAIHTDSQHTVLHLVAAEAVGNTLLDGMKSGSEPATIDADADALADAPTE